MKKIYKNLMAIATVASPIVATVSCNTGNPTYARYDTKYDGEVNIKTTFSSGGHQMEALNALVDEYNNTQKLRKNYIPVKVSHAEGGFGDYVKTIYGTKLLNKENDIANIVIDYPGSVGSLGAADQQLNLKDVGVTGKGIDPKMGEINDRIGGFGKGGIYSVPLALSGEEISIDGPLLAQIVSDIQQAGGKVELTGVLKKAIDNKDAWASNNKAYLKSGGGKKDELLKTIVLNNKTFESFESLIEFSDQIARAYGIKPENSDFKVLAHDSPTNLLYQMVFGKGDNKYKNFLFNKGNNKEGYIEYLVDKKANYENLKWAQDLITNSITGGSMWLGGGGAYASPFLTNHKMLIEMGSTAGFSHTFIEAGTLVYEINDENSIDADKKSKAKKSTKDRLKAGTRFEHVDKPKANTGDVSKNLIATFGSHDNHIYDANVKKMASKKYDIKLLKDVKKETIEKIKNGEGYVTRFALAKYLKGSIEVAEKKNSKYYFVPLEDLKGVKLSADDSLNKDEVIHIPSPLYAKKIHPNETGIIFKNGPSFIPIHTNKAEDKGVAAFVNWFLALNKTSEGKQILKNFSKTSGYIVPYAGYLGQVHPDYKDANKILFNLLKSNPGANVMQTPIDDTTTGFRSDLSSKLKSIYSMGHNGTSIPKNHLIQMIKNLIHKMG